MPLLKAFDPPGFLTDFDQIPGQLDAWSAAVSGWFDGNIQLLEGALSPVHGQVQFYNETKSEPSGLLVDQVIPWSALPGTLRNRYGRALALQLADAPVPLTQRMDGPGSYFVGAPWQSLFYRPQDEYCEWFVARDEQGQITRVTFTSEPPEYWQAMHGDTLQDVNNNPAYHFPGDKQLLLELYREYISPEVQLADLEAPEDLYDVRDPNNPTLILAKGSYNQWNRWNTLGGIMHLTHYANSLSAEINLGAQATLQRTDHGRPVIDPEAIISSSGFGGLNRTSDPTIGSTVNELAALGGMVTLRNPVGLAMNHMNLAGMEGPDGQPIDASFFQVLRGRQEQGLVERAVFAVPASEGYTVSDITIGGVPITHGSQLAERIVVNIVGRVGELGTVTPQRLASATASCQSVTNGNLLSYRDGQLPCEPIAEPAFAYPGVKPATAGARGALVATAHRRHTRRA